MGYATIGRIGFEGRFDYAAIGTVTNLSARLCQEARDGQILVSQQVHAEIERLVETAPIGAARRSAASPSRSSVYDILGLAPVSRRELPRTRRPTAASRRAGSPGGPAPALAVAAGHGLPPGAPVAAARRACEA